jgi:hypothetical protein
MPVGENDVNWITEIFSATTHLGTHFDPTTAEARAAYAAA